MAEVERGFSKAACRQCGPEARVAANNAAAAPFNPVPPGGCVSESEVAALANAIRQACRKALAALRCSDLRQHQLIITSCGWYYTIRYKV